MIEKQSDINNLSIWADDASGKMKIAVDSDVLLFILNKAYNGPGGIPLFLPGANMWRSWELSLQNLNLGTNAAPVNTVGRNPSTGQVEMLTLSCVLVKLDEQNIPETGRWVVMPTWATFN